MQDRHTNKERYFQEQDYTTRTYVIPFARSVMAVDPGTTVLEVGCGEAGNLKPFVDMGCESYGIDMSQSKIANAGKFFGDHPQRSRLHLIADDAYHLASHTDRKFDLILLRDTIEHIYNQEKFMAFIRHSLAEKGHMFIAFPPWMNPFGGHQQTCRSRVLSKLPYFHLLPRPVYKGILRLFGETPENIVSLMEIVDTRLTIERWERILRAENMVIHKRVFYFINPNYEVKFGLKPRIIWSWIGAIPWWRNFFITTAYYMIANGDSSA